MEVSDQLLALYTAEVEERSDEYVVRVPENELDIGDINHGDVYRIAVLPQTQSTASTQSTVQSQKPQRRRQPSDSEQHPDPPVQVGDEREVTIESTGEEGDGVAKVDHGYVVIVPDASKGDTVRIRLETVRANVGFADVVEYVD